MRDPLQFQEIENLGENEEIGETQDERGQSTGSAVPLLQAALCVLALLALVFLKFTNPETYGRVTDWYRSEAAREIELPQWSGKGKEASALPSSEPPETPITAELEDGSPQRV